LQPKGELSVLQWDGSGYKRLYPDSTDVRFNSAGRMTAVYDPDNNATTFTYDGSNRLIRITTPKAGTINLTYGTNGLATIYDSLSASAKRTTTFTVAANKTLTKIKQPNTTDSTVIQYNGSLELWKVTAPNGGTTEYAYHATTGELWKIIDPAVPIYNQGNLQPTTVFVPWPRKVAPSSGTSGTPWAAPAASAVWDSVTAPEGQVTRSRVNRFGDPVQIDVPLTFDTDITYTADGFPVKVVRSGGWGTDTVAYDSSKRPVWIRYATSTATPQQIRYGAFSRPDSIWGAGGQAQRRFVNASTGRIDSLRIGGTTSYTASVKYLYNSNGQVTRITDQEGVVVSRRGYDTMGNLKADTAPGNRVTVLGRDAFGRVTTVTPPVGAVQTTYYDVLNRPDSIRDGVNTKAIRFARGTTWGTTTDPKDQVYRTDVNLLGWAVSERDPLSRADSLWYDRNGLLRAWKNRRLQTTTFTYDAALRPLIAGGDTLSYHGGTNGRRIRAANAYARDSIFLNARGAPDSVKTYFPVLNKTYVIRYYYNADGLTDSVKPSGPSVTFLTRKYIYNTARGTLDRITLSTDITNIAQAADLATNQITFPGNRIVNLNRTSANAVAETDATAAYATTTDRQAGYDKNNRVKTQLQLDASTGHRYGYDGLGRLVADSTVSVTGAQCPPLTDDGFLCSSWTYQGHLTFTYDAASNRTDAGASYLAGSNQIRNFAGCSYSTDNDGNVTSESCPDVTKTYSWDARNRLTQAVVGTTTYDVRYDTQGRVVRLDVNGTASEYFLWDGDDLLAELNSSGAIVLEYSYYPGMDDLHAVKKGSASTIYYAHPDLLGSVIALTDGSTVSRTYVYSTWGADIGGSDAAGFNGTDRARWKGALLFPEVGLYYMRARWYHVVQGRFMSEDPIKLAGGINPYIFAGDDPINGRDPTGLWCKVVPANEISGEPEKLVCEDLSAADWYTIRGYLNSDVEGSGDWFFAWASKLGWTTGVARDAAGQGTIRIRLEVFARIFHACTSPISVTWTSAGIYHQLPFLSVPVQVRVTVYLKGGERFQMREDWQSFYSGSYESRMLPAGLRVTGQISGWANCFGVRGSLPGGIFEGVGVITP
jgi:RHS repeat-associated protein